MCYLINVVATGFEGDLPELFRTFGLQASPSENPTVLSALGGVPYDIVEGQCSCSVFRPSAPGADAEAKINSARKRYEKQGWSEAKIARALEGISKAQSRAGRPPTCDFPGAIGALARSGARVRLLCHFYSGQFRDEAFSLASPISMTLDNPDFQVCTFPQDTVVMISAAQQHTVVRS